MLIPNAHNAIVDIRKLRNYCHQGRIQGLLESLLGNGEVMPLSHSNRVKMMHIYFVFLQLFAIAMVHRTNRDRMAQV